jgi:release factor glutamine methyltransferase
VSFVLGTDRFQEAPVSPKQAARVRFLVTRHQKGVPVSKLVGQKPFWEYLFCVNRYVLDPRPDSETLIEAALRVIPEDFSGSLLDFGTGSGCLLETLLLQRPHMRGLGVDCSPAALRIAHKNAVRLGVASRARFVCSHWGAALNGQQKWPVIIANPPYIARKEIPMLSPSVRCDPLLALLGGDDGLECYRALAPHIQALLSPGGQVFLEIGAGQQSAVREILRSLSYRESYRDLSGRVRVLRFSL